MDEILKYFPALSDVQKHQFAALSELYRDWNAKINVISRKDIDYLYEHHVLHSLAIGKVLRFPGIPLAILFPNCQFKLIDGTGKKIRVATEVSNAIGLKNVVIEQLRGEDEKGKYDFIVSRAVMKLSDLMKIIHRNIAKEQHNALPNGVFCLKGGDVTHEVMPYKKIVQITPIHTLFKEEWFKEKNVIYVPI